MNAKPAFDADRIAYFETTGWRAYYDRKMPRLLTLIVRLCHEQFRIPWPQALLASYYATRASIAWVPMSHDVDKVLGFYERFYRIAARYSGLGFNPRRAAELELLYNDDHRRLVGNEDKTDLLQTMVELHAVLFGISESAARESAQYRVSALNTVDKITGKTSTDIEGDWRSIEADLQLCYRSIASLIAEPSPPSPLPPNGRGEN